MGSQAKKVFFFLLKKEGKPAISKICPILASSIQTNLPLVCHFLRFKKLQKEISIPNALFTGISSFDGFWAIKDQKMSKSGSKIKKYELTLNFNQLPGQKFGTPAHETGKTLKLDK